MSSYEKQGRELLRIAREQNVIGTTFPALQKLAYGGVDRYRDLMATVEAQARQTLVESPWLGKQSSWQLPQTRRYQQSRAPSSAALVQPSPGSWMAELARFPVPFGSVGIIKGFEQFASQGETIYTSSGNWGNPFPSSSFRWFLRLSPIQMVGAAWINVSGASAIVDYLPGTPYDDFADTTGLWFPAASSSSTNIHLPIPGGFVLRLIVLVVESGDPVSIAAKLVGTTQSELNDKAQFTVGTTW